MKNVDLYLPILWPTYSELDRYYGQDYHAYQESDNTKLNQVVPNGKRLLDYGCGSGEFLIQKCNESYDVYGIDIDESAVEIARGYGFTVKKAQARKVEFDNEFFDEIRLNHVLEHISYLNPIMTELYRCLKPGGKIMVEVPNIASFDAKIKGSAWRPLDVPTHLYHFSPRSLVRLVHKTGFKDVEYYTKDLPVFDKNLFYLKGAYTSMKIDFHLKKGLNIFRLLSAAVKGMINIIRYAFHCQSEDDGFLLYLSACK